MVGWGGGRNAKAENPRAQSQLGNAAITLGGLLGLRATAECGQDSKEERWENVHVYINNIILLIQYIYI